MNNIEMIRAMLKKQKELNIKTCGGDLDDPICKKTGKKIDWRLCLRMEAMELIDSFNWKHWKNTNNDRDNASMEFVDMVHFLLSEIIMVSEQGGKGPSEEKIASILFNEIKDTTFLLGIENIIDTTNEVIKYSLDEKFGSIVDMETAMNKLMHALSMTPELTFNLYLSKNWLNEFRVKNGYAEGTYRKVFAWGESPEPEEDNKVLMGLVEAYGLDMGKQMFEKAYEGKL